MVKPYEEEQSEGLNERELKTLLTIFFRYIQDTYKQFKWNLDMRSHEGKIYDCLIETRSKVSETIAKIDSLVRIEEKKMVVVIFGIEEIIRGSTMRRSKRSRQDFPITGKSPRELGRLAKNMFKWVKQQM